MSLHSTLFTLSRVVFVGLSSCRSPVAMLPVEESEEQKMAEVRGGETYCMLQFV